MTKFKPLACGHHSHTHYSLDGGSSPADKIMEASRQGRIADACTDHGILSGLASHWFAAEKLHKDGKISKIKSIHGIEAYIIDPDRPYKEYKTGRKEPQYYHLTIHFKTKEAYQYFCKLSAKAEERAVVKYGERKPLITFEELEGISGHVIISSGCLLAPIQSNILRGRSDLAKKYYEYLRTIAGPGNFFVEVMPHQVEKNWKKPEYSENGIKVKDGYFVPADQKLDSDAIDPPFQPDPCTGLIDLQKVPNQFVIEMAKKFKDPIVMSLDDHFATKEDKVVQSLKLSNGKENWQFYNSLHSMTSEECAEVFKRQLGSSDKDIEEWIDNSYLFVESFDKYTFETAKDRILLPTTELVYGVKTDNKQKLYELVQKHGRMPTKGHPDYKTYKDRFVYELDVLTNNGVVDFLPYFFLVEDAMSWARENGVVSMARGSGSGSLIAYLLRIAIADPIKYNLPFERFLTKDRIKTGSFPDFDCDFANRDVIVEYLSDKYKDNFAYIPTDMLMRFKSSLLDVERSVHGKVPESITQMCKSIKGAQQGQTDKEWLFGYTDKTTGEHIRGFIDLDDPIAEQLRVYRDSYPDRWDVVIKCIGTIKTRGIHAGGVVVTPGPVWDYFPVIKTDKGYAAAYEMKNLEAVGGIKYDFLGVSTLNAMSSALEGIRKDRAEDIKWDEFIDDEDVFVNIVHKMDLGGLFQIDTKSMKPFVAKTKPRNIRDLAALISLVRPGALDADSPNPNFKGTAADYYVACKNGSERPYYIHPELEPILRETEGICLYQEQTLQIFRDLAGYTYGEAEEVRRAIGKKVKSVMDHHLGILESKLLARGWSQEQATKLTETIIKSARYSFNKSHGISYSILSYNTMWMKYHYPLYFWKGILEINAGESKDNFKVLRDLLAECGGMVSEVTLDKSHKDQWIVNEKAGKIIPPLSLIKGMGLANVDKVLKSLEDAGIR